MSRVALNYLYFMCLLMHFPSSAFKKNKTNGLFGILKRYYTTGDLPGSSTLFQRHGSTDSHGETQWVVKQTKRYGYVKGICRKEVDVDL